MSSLSSVESKLPPGFRFHPRDEELICDYLIKWMNGSAQNTPFLIQVDLNKCEPWDIPETACVGGKEWYFYSQRDRKYATGLRTNRATVSGYWKATGKDRAIVRKGTLVGMRKTLVFYEGRAPKGRKTDWVMHEFRIEGSIGPGPKMNVASVKDEDWVLCRVFYKNRSEGNQGNASKDETDGHDEATTSSLSLPPLMESHITFEQTQTSTAAIDEAQVPCFSIFSPSQTAPTNFCPQMEPLPFHEMLPNSVMPPHHQLGSINNFNFYNNNNNNYSQCSNYHDKKVIKAVLSHLTKMESGIHVDDFENLRSIKGSCSSFGEGSSDSYLSEVGLCSIWNHYSGN